MFALRTDTGKLVWRKMFRHCSAASPTVVGDVVYMSFMQPRPCQRYPRTQRGFIVALRVSDGKELWRKSMPATESSLLFVAGVLYYGAWDGAVYALDTRSRKVRWRTQTDGEINGSAAYGSKMVFVGNNAGSMYALDAATGAVRWRARSQSGSFARASTSTRPLPSPTVACMRRIPTAVCTRSAPARGTCCGNAGQGHTSTQPPLYGIGRCSSGPTTAASSRSTRRPETSSGPRRTRFDPRCSDRDGRSRLLRDLRDVWPPRPAERKTGRRATFALDARTGKQVWSFADGQYSPVVADSTQIYIAGRAWVYALTPVRKG